MNLVGGLHCLIYSSLVYGNVFTRQTKKISTTKKTTTHVDSLGTRSACEAITLASGATAAARAKHPSHADLRGDGRTSAVRWISIYI